jgi:hypothetical protein
MTHDDHHLMVLMFARTFQAMAAITETLKSRGIWTEDDEKAFNFAVHQNDAVILRCAALAMTEYLKVAAKVGVETGLDNP